MTDMPRIHVLSDHVANKIAAGEVVDRPSSVLKELMENALDAKSTQVDVQVVAGGKRLVSVADNGHGMSRDNALLSVERHATSKIRDVDDIEHVATLGFRGEALAAIASVSRFTLITRPADALSGTEIMISGGKMLDVKEIGCPPGTRFEVRNLFFNVPARRKFLRADATELAHLRQTFIVYALAHPEAGLTFTVDDRPVYRLAAGADLSSRVRELFGAEQLRNLRPVDSPQGEVRVSGLVALPHAHRADRTEQFVFINGRPASAPVVNFAISEAYQTLVPRGRHPSIYLFLSMEPDLVDVNVHPTKKEVRFRHSNAVRDAILAAIRQVITSPGQSPTGPPPMSGEGADTAAVPPVLRLRIEDLPELPAFNYPRLTPQMPGREEGGEDAVRFIPDATKAEGDASPGGNSPWSWCRILGQAGGLYVVMETEDGLVLMDPHAAHERILYERFMRELVKGAIKSQGLLTPETVELTPDDARRVLKYQPMLETMGFGLSEFGGDTFLIDALPVCLGNASARHVLADVASSLDQGGERGGTETWARDRVAKSACRAAVKANDKLTIQEIEQLVIDLAKAEMPYTCPHGRPTLIFMGFGELDKKFGRV